MIEKKVMYYETRPEHIEKIFSECAKPEIDLCYYEPTTGKKGELKDVECILAHGKPLTRELIDQMPNLKLIQCVGIGYSQHPIDYAKEKGIYVCNCRDGASNSVAELCIALMISLYRRIPQLSALTRKGEWHSWTYRHDSHSIYGKTVGVIGGNGAIGRNVLEKCAAFGMDRIYYDVARMSENVERELGARYVDLETLLKTADVVMMFVPLLPSTRHMIGANELKLMKKSAILINDSRGECIDQMALVEALKHHEIWGAALDVTDPEPICADDPLFQIEDTNLIVTPHLGSSTVEVMEDLFRASCQNALKVLRGERPDNIVNGL